ncbi:hypothetical protein K450DRAFT_248236 [Umbelopsis ramanniana AG]|uniref:Uncharacterized protein n=1 Tax=Umbelopsis ramanniana AG TaxID=1314678 RepID=A0AAD5E7G1_UMBRA|nr:uncharacterized protein K450DRAFT_248236 [Umbelopsis ramanniana AG]KAI8578127.1 hypothetical protein K450DRAFT_248236 [Umbelopsis ramanniana AG]
MLTLSLRASVEASLFFSTNIGCLFDINKKQPKYSPKILPVAAEHPGVWNFHSKGSISMHPLIRATFGGSRGHPVKQHSMSPIGYANKKEKQSHASPLHHAH